MRLQHRRQIDKINLLLAENNENLISAHFQGPKIQEAPRIPNQINTVDCVKKVKDVKNQFKLPALSLFMFSLQERTKNAQFIIISLRNNMFELADRLIGIFKTDNCTKSVAINPRAIASTA